MAPVAVDSHTGAGPATAAVKLPALTKQTTQGQVTSQSTETTTYPQPLQQTGVLDRFAYEETTPVIGREYAELPLRDFLKADNSEELFRELAIIISRRGVVAFRKQDITPEEQKEITARISKAAGSPAESGLHIHPVMNAQRDTSYLSSDKNGTVSNDDTISIIHSAYRREAYKERSNKPGREEWHSDVTFEPVPADYSSLLVHTGPETGGDTLFSSGYEVYDLLSPAFRTFAEGLTGRFAQPFFNKVAAETNRKIHPGPRGSPHNVGDNLEAFHPFIRTNPVTGWKSVFGLGSHFDSLVGLSQRESQIIKDYILELVTSSHGAQARYKWGKDTLIIFDNRSVYHAATPDYAGERIATRVVGVGEKPYFDPASKSRREELGERLI
ncbi:unnamed protein product [Parajaminaea phylloscopi]